MDFEYNGITVHGASDIYEARAFAETAGAGTYEIFIERDKGQVRELYNGKVPFDRIRRITGYLVGTLDRFNDAKRAEEHDRVKHGVPKR